MTELAKWRSSGFWHGRALARRSPNPSRGLRLKGNCPGSRRTIRRTVEAYPFMLGNTVISVTLSVGVAASPADGVTVDTLVEADRAQDAAKRAGGNKIRSANPLSQT